MLAECHLQVIGFLGMTTGLLVLSITGSDGSTTWVVLGLVVLNLMLNFGPNATTYLLPAQLFPTRVRATGHGVAAASGKVGAVVGTFLLTPAVATVGLHAVMLAMAVLGLVGAIVTVAFRVEPRQDVG